MKILIVKMPKKNSTIYALPIYNSKLINTDVIIGKHRKNYTVIKDRTGSVKVTSDERGTIITID